MDCLINLEAPNYDCINNPITYGIPLPVGAIQKKETISLINEKNEIVPLQTSPIILWPDNSIKWLLLDFQASMGKNELSQFRIIDKNNPISIAQRIIIKKKDDCFVVNTGGAEFFIDDKIFKPFIKVTVDGSEVINSQPSKTTLIDHENIKYEPIIDSIVVESIGNLRSVIKIEGTFVSEKRQITRYISRIHFYLNKKFVKIDFTLWNSGACKHENGLWDLGDPGSVYIKDLSIITSVQHNEPLTINWQTDFIKDTRFKFGQFSNFSIYQDSSGCKNWKSKNHINRIGDIPLSFKGFRLSNNNRIVFEGEKANPVLCLGNNTKTVSCAIKNFWQNFPKALDIENDLLVVRLFPKYFGDFHELQGGERKTHTIFLEYGSSTPNFISMLNSAKISLSPEYYANTGVFPYFCLLSDFKDERYETLIQEVVSGTNSFFNRRDVIDEYGWRNFGEIYADHEAIGYLEKPPLISHYNNQYDFIYSAIRQYALKGDSRWFELMDDLAHHLVDIDIYHTDKDRTEYNNALFWHTNHYLDAATCTHRSESVDHLNYSNPMFCGGGPALEHNYTTGLMYHYLITGNQVSKEAVILLADWAVRLMDRPETLVAMVKYIKRNFAVWKRVFKGETLRYDRFPFTRESGNCISVLLDAYQLTHNRKYLDSAEEIIIGCIHPNDNIDGRDLLNTELNWSYTACLQGIGKFLDFKYSIKEFDEVYYYSLASLKHYAQWMLDNEYPYLDKPEKLEYPNETWPAQDLRKSCIFYFAAKYSEGELRDVLLTKGKFYYEYAIDKMSEFNTKTLARPLVLLLQNGYMHHYFSKKNHEKVKVSIPEGSYFYNNDGNLTRYKIIRILFDQCKKILKSTSIKEEFNWVRNRLYKHI